jgi:SagB-type dehydrogenase family enzyme
VSVEQALAVRRSVRHFGPEGLSLVQVSQLLWAAYGVSKPWPESASLAGGLRTAPSAGACYPLELYLVVGNVAGLPAGVYRYRSDSHALRPVRTGDVRAALCAAAWGQEFVSAAPVSIVYFAVYRRTTDRYGRRGRERYVCMDLGHSAENVYLQCAALGLGTCAVGAFNDAAVSRVICANQAEEPLYIMPVGRPQASTQTATQQRR